MCKVFLHKITNQMENIRDKFVKATFSDTNRAIAFFEKFLPEELVASLETLFKNEKKS